MKNAHHLLVLGGGVAGADKVCGEVKELTGTLKDNLGRVVQHGKGADFIVNNMLLHSREARVMAVRTLFVPIQGIVNPWWVRMWCWKR